MKLLWNSIVKNEAAIIERCVNSLLPHISGAVIADTGSSDGTPDMLARLFDAAGVPLELHHESFEDFSQARNIALHLARESKLPWDYLLLADADMELRVKRADWINGHVGQAYDMRQFGGGLCYSNRRLVSRKATGSFVGVTHEFLDIPSDGLIDGADFLDHADGANRPDKFIRDIALLEEALKTETRPGIIARYHFYLAQSYFDLGKFEQAAELYRKRVELGGYAEECWYAQRQLAICYERLGSFKDFVWEAIRAYEMRPLRAESLYDLARGFRSRGENFSSLLFSEPGLASPFPHDDMLFVNEYIYNTGTKEEFSICAYYDKNKRKRGAKLNDKLALDGNSQAQFNSYWYMEPLQVEVPSFQAKRIAFPLDVDGYLPMNPSVINYQGQPLTLVRTVNYTIGPEGQYTIRGPGGAIHTRNWLCRNGEQAVEIKPPANFPAPKYGLVLGFEDSRLFQWRQEFWTLSTVRELTHEGWCEQVLASIDLSDNGSWRYGNSWRQILPSHRAHEKNWMPWVDGDELRFVYRLGALVDLDGYEVARYDPGFDVSHISGGSQVVKIGYDTMLAVVHEARTIPGRPNRYYSHRFVVFNRQGKVAGISSPFFFHDRQIEFCAGLAYFPDRHELMLSYGVMDREAWTATLAIEEVRRFVFRDVL